jgi:hypothetical protein
LYFGDNGGNKGQHNTKKNLEAVTEKNPRFAQFEQERKPADTTPSLSLSLFWFSFPYHSHRVKRNL